MTERRSLASIDRPRYAGRMLRTVLLVSAHVLAIGLALLPGCGGARTRMIEGHSVVLEGSRERARIAVDGVQMRVVYSPTEDRYRAPGCDFGSAATVDSLAEQMATSPATCERIEAE